MLYVYSVSDFLKLLPVDALCITIPNLVLIWLRSGHTYALGALLALAHDHRLMKTERGWFCLPEIQLKLPFTSGLVALAK